MFAHRIFVPDKATDPKPQQSLHHLRIELAATIAPDLLQSVLMGPGLTIGPVGGDGVVGIDHSEDARPQGYLVPPEATGVAMAGDQA